MTRDAILAEVEKAQRLLTGLRSRVPADRLLEHAEQLLTGLRSQIIAHWPLSAPDEVELGRFAVRAFDDGAYPDLVAQLVRIDSLIKGRGGSSGRRQPGTALQPPQ
jgi:hypothetical protein